jgi:bifunctional UDP-N-acetylglucosamine pyrophosphorylase/glucosamine-1-phosphate N-acetyltransferase
MPLAAAILAAGLGTRMRSERPKVLHEIAGLPLIQHVVGIVREAGARPIVIVVGSGASEVRAAVRARFGEAGIAFALQREQRGTGHAVRCALPKLRGVRGDVLLVYGDMPLIRPETLTALAQARRRARALLAIGTVRLPDPGDYGRVRRDARGRVVGVVEARDASALERRIEEINTGLYAADAEFLRRALPRLRAVNIQREYYLTDLVSMAAERGRATTLTVEDPAEVQGINTRADLAAAEASWRRRRARELMLAGVTIEDPERCYLDADVTVEPDARLGAGAHLQGRTSVARGASIGTGAVLCDCRIGEGARVGAYAVLEGAEVGAGATAEPLVVLRGR